MLKRQMQAMLTEHQISVYALAKLDPELCQLFHTIVSQSLPCRACKCVSCCTDTVYIMGHGAVPAGSPWWQAYSVAD